MHYTSLSEQIKELIFEPALVSEEINEYLFAILLKSSTELELLSRVRETIGNLTQSKSYEIQLLDKEITLTGSNHKLFYEIVYTIKVNLIAFKHKLVRGTFKSGLSKEHTFLYEYYYDYFTYLNAHGYVFDIWEAGRESLPTFDFRLREMENGSDLKVTGLYADPDHYYNGKGISIAIILEAKLIFNKRIISSANRKSGDYGEFNTPEAIEKVWNRMVKAGLAVYDSNLDYYIVL
jgi:hypothetical protein